MYAIIETGSKQYRVAAGDKVEIELRCGTETLKLQATLDHDEAGESK